ncbi:MAG TPA: flagellar basal-body rod protein FlgF [Bryobacteraceae bacterium]|nr:flagellar basal-body rod protein FlgF [Bryobacteraceae bacterium]
MDTTSAMAAAGLRSRMQELDMLANNLANTGTGGFKLDREFYSLFSAADNDVDGEASTDTMPMIRKQWTDFAQGTLTPTGNPLDLAISGKGFFAVQAPAGNLYTRNGSFKISADGTIATGDGYPVLSVDGAPIQLPGQGAVTVGTDGTVSQAGQPVAQLQLSDFTDRTLLTKVGNSYFQTAPKQKPVAAAEAEIQQGQVEGSNVAPAESAVRLVGVMRQFEMLQKAIMVTSDMDKKSLDEVARVASGA